MGCSVSSPLLEKPLKYLTKREPHDAVSLCRARKRLVKEAIKRRQDFANAHLKYTSSLSSVSNAINVFVSRYDSSSITPSEFFVTFQSQENDSKNDNKIDCECFEGLVDDFGVNCVEIEEDEGNHKWDFFNLVKNEGGMKEELKEGSVCKEEGKVVERSGKEEGNYGRELLEALKDVEDYFMRAFESCREVSRMLEIDRVPFLPNFEEIKGGESGVDRKSSLSCTSSDISSTLTEHPLEDGQWGMISGSHSFTLGRLYAWEKKLYHEVKAGQQTRKIYKQKCSQLQSKDSDRDDVGPSKASSEVTDLYHLMVVALQHAESISKQIKKIRDEELQPQLFELLHGLLRNWNSMSKTHEIQYKIIKEINTFTYQKHWKSNTDSQRQATHQLETVIQTWNSSFSDYVSTQKSYIKSLRDWLSMFIEAESQYHYTTTSSLPLTRFNGPTLMVTCQRWSTFLDRFPDFSVKYALKSLAKDIQALWVQQGVEEQQKRKLDGLNKEMEKKMLTFGKAEDKALVIKNTVEGYEKVRDDYLSEKKKQLEILRQRVETERERHQSSVQETELVAMKRLQMGFLSAFESLADFSRASAKVYGDLITLSQNIKV